MYITLYYLYFLSYIQEGIQSIYSIEASNHKGFDVNFGPFSKFTSHTSSRLNPFCIPYVLSNRIELTLFQPGVF